MILTDPAQRAGAAAQTPPPSTAPATTKRALFYGSKSAPVDLTPAAQIEPPTTSGEPAVTTAPATQLIR